ncbi:MAG: SDR family NAD(P)-dependent oxidoreductase [Parvularculaceae bacterium]|nr:SDR family NAD(P)-dependent oxidoreductase [Parvularculaceae bacterium]
MRLKNKVALITGATGGIGEATAKLFLAEGARVMLVGRSDQKLRETRDRLGGGEMLGMAVAEAADEAGIKAAVAATLKKFDRLDILFANAGTEGDLKAISDLTVEEFQAVLTTNVIGVWLSMKHCEDALKASGKGSIIATSSIAGAIGFPNMSPYIASKHAVCGLVKTAALEYGPANIRVNAVAPGPIDNRMMASLGEQLAPGATQAMRAQIEQTVALKRYGTNEEVANLALFLASDEASYCTGGYYLVDGGYVAA